MDKKRVLSTLPDTTRFIYKYARFPRESHLMDADSAALRLSVKLKSLDVSGLDISDYTKRYLAGYIKNLDSVLSIHSYILSLALASFKASFSGLSFLDYGGGSASYRCLQKSWA